MERDAAAVDSLGLLHPPTAVGYNVETEPPSAKEKSHIIIPGRGTEEPGARPSEPSFVAVSSSSKKSLTCVYLPDALRQAVYESNCSLSISHRPMTSFQLGPEILSGSSTSPVLQPAHGFHSKSAQATQCPRQRAFLCTQRTPTSEQHRQASNNSTPNDDRIGIQSSPRHTSEAMPPSSYSTASPARSKSRTQASKSKSALPMLKMTNLKGSSAAAAMAVEEMGDRRRRSWSLGIALQVATTTPA
jgi:hypothetical protein